MARTVWKQQTACPFSLFESSAGETKDVIRYIHPC